MKLIDCTETLDLVYDRGKDGYGVPVPGVRFRGTQELYDALTAIRRDLKQMEWLQCIESVLTAGLYVKKPGEHGKGIAWDFDGVVGVVLKPIPLTDPPIRRVLTYKCADTDFFWVGNVYHERKFLTDKLKTRLACLFSLIFGVVLTAGYNAAHEDHIHCDLSEPVAWRGSRSQVVCLQETLNAWFNAGLVVDGIYGDKTVDALNNGFSPYPMRIGVISNEIWLDWLKMIVFNPPKDVK